MLFRFSKKKSKRGKKLHSALASKSKRMKELGVAYRAGQFGDMTWRQVIKKYLGNSTPIGSVSGSVKRKSRSRSKKSKRTKNTKADEMLFDFGLL